MLEMMGERKRNTHGTRREEGRGAREADWRPCEQVGNEFLLALTQAGARLFGDLLTAPPSQHQERDRGCDEQRKPSSLEKLHRIRQFGIFLRMQMIDSDKTTRQPQTSRL